MSRKLLSSCVVLLALLGAQVRPALARRPIVAIFDIHAKRVHLSRAASEALGAYLASRLTSSGAYQVVPKDQISAALRQQKKRSYRRCYKQSCQIAIGQELSADKSLATSILRIGKTCVVTVTLYDLKKGTTDRGADAEAPCRESALMRAIKTAVSKLTRSRITGPGVMVGATARAIRGNKGKDKKTAKAPGGGRQTSSTRGPDDAAMVSVPAGPFLRGSPKGYLGEKPQRTIMLDAFLIDKHEVTVAQYQRCVRGGDCKTPGTGPQCNWNQKGRKDHPINCVTWREAERYCRWAEKRLPTEAEWEKAARGKDGRLFPWGAAKATCTRAIMNEAPMAGDRVWAQLSEAMKLRRAGCHRSHTWPVGSKSPAGDSPFHAQDMAGNVAEWTADWYGTTFYRKGPGTNPRGPVKGTLRIARGGSWEKHAADLRTASRLTLSPTVRSVGIGFRCAKTP